MLPRPGARRQGGRRVGWEDVRSGGIPLSPRAVPTRPRTPFRPTSCRTSKNRPTGRRRAPPAARGGPYRPADARRCIHRWGLREQRQGRAPVPAPKRRPRRARSFGSPGGRPPPHPDARGTREARGWRAAEALGGRPAGWPPHSDVSAPPRPAEDRPPRCRATGPAGRPRDHRIPPVRPAGRRSAVPPALRVTGTGTATRTGTGTETETAATRCVQRWGLRGRGRGRALAPEPGRAPVAGSVAVAEPVCVPVPDRDRPKDSLVRRRPGCLATGRTRARRSVPRAPRDARPPRPRAVAHRFGSTGRGSPSALPPGPKGPRRAGP